MHPNMKRIAFNASDKDCSICLDKEVLMTIDTCTILDCGHIFHEECITKWNREKMTCPACRESTITKNVNIIERYEHIISTIESLNLDEISDDSSDDSSIDDIDIIYNKHSLLLYTVKKNDTYIAKFIIEVGDFIIDSDIKDIINYLSYTIKNNNIELTKIFINALYEKDYHEYEVSTYIFDEVIAQNNVNMIKYLINSYGYEIGYDNKIALIIYDNISLIKYYMNHMDDWCRRMSCTGEEYFDDVALIIKYGSNEMKSALVRILNYNIKKHFEMWTNMLNYYSEIDHTMVEFFCERLPLLDYNAALATHIDRAKWKDIRWECMDNSICITILLTKFGALDATE